MKPPCYYGQLLLVTAIAVLSTAADAVADEFKSVIGRQQTVFPDGYQGMHYFPDEPIVVIKTRPWSWLIVDCDKSVLMQGPTLETSVPTRVVLAPGASGEFDSGYAGISGLHHDIKRGEILALYHAEKRLRDGQPENRILDWSIGLAISKDGATFQKMGQVITSSTLRTDPNKTHHGVGDPSLCLDASGEWLYCYYTDLSQLDGRPNTICMARCSLASGGRPGSWQKFYEGGFSEPGLNGKDSSIVSPPIDQSGVGHPSVQYVRSVGKYVMILTVLGHSEFNQPVKPKVSGIYMALSDNGIKWSVPQQLFAAHVIAKIGQETSIRPYLHIEKSTGDAISGRLLYSYSRSWEWAVPHTPHYMVQRAIQIKLSAPFVDRLTGTKWVNSNNVTFEWTKDGRFLRGGTEKKWKPLGENRVEVIFNPGHSDILEFSGDFRSFTQSIKGGTSTFSGHRQ